MLCPGRQALAEAFLGVHFQLGGEDQVGLFFAHHSDTSDDY